MAQHFSLPKNDIDSGLVNFYRVLRDDEKYKRFAHLANLSLYSREEFVRLRKTWKDIDDDIERAWAFWYVARMSFSGSFGNSWSYCLTLGRRGMAATTSKFLSCVDNLDKMHDRIRTVQIENDDVVKIINRYDTNETLFYLDPPYIHSTRSAGKYAYEMTDDDHAKMLDAIRNIKGKCLLSGYDSEIYKVLDDSGWKRVDYKTACYAAGRTRSSGIIGVGAALQKQPRTEVLWMNYTPPQQRLVNDAL